MTAEGPVVVAQVGDDHRSGVVEVGFPATTSRRRAPTTLVLASIVVGLAFAAPFGYIAWRNVTLGADIVEVFASADTLLPLWRTVVLATAVGLATVVVGTGLAWLTTRTDLPLRRLWQVLAPLSLVFPSFVGAAAMIGTFARGGLAESLLAPIGVDRMPVLEGFWATWFVLTLFTYPFVYLPVAARLRGLPPTLEESARLLGRSPTGVFATVVIPQIARAILAGALLVFLYTLSDFGVVQLMRYSTLTREIFLNQPFNLPKAFALALLLGIFAVAVVIAERRLSRLLPQTRSVQSRRPVMIKLGRWRWPALASVVAVIGAALVAPLVSLAWWAWRGLARRGDVGAALVEDLGALAEPARHTVVLGVVSAVAAVAFVLPVAYLVSRYRSVSGGMANAFVVGGFALPGLSIALALVFWTVNTPVLSVFYQTIPLLVFAYVVNFGAQAMRASQVAVMALPDRYEDAARMLGAGRVRRLVTVEVPLLLPGLLAGAGLVLLSVMKELPATLLLSPPGYRTLATRIWGALDSGLLSRVGLGSLVLVALSGVLTWFLIVRRADAFD